MTLSLDSQGFAFINYASFEAADAALEAMNGQYLCNRSISVSFAFKKDAKGERHGSAAERLLATQNPLSQADRPHQLFADAPPVPQPPQSNAIPPPPPPNISASGGPPNIGGGGPSMGLMGGPGGAPLGMPSRFPRRVKQGGVLGSCMPAVQPTASDESAWKG